MWSIWDDSDYYGRRWATYETGETYESMYHNGGKPEMRAWPVTKDCPLFKSREELYAFADKYLGGIKYPYIIEGPMEVYDELQGI